MKLLGGALVILVTMAAATNCSRILVFFPFPARSHMFVFESVVRDLVERGHEVTTVSSRALEDIRQPNYRPIVIRDLLKDIHGK